MAKNLDSNKLISGIRKDFKKDESATATADNIVKRIHENSANEKEKNESEMSIRTSLDIPKSLFKKIKHRALERDLSFKDYMLGLAEKDIEKQ